ncbi:hypothetical protein CVT25_003577 [Psilocybe cyanescens]|uniref:Uncharacterized protein n=1 Tax=Psilocybe cyanescens TaxID=93625 RepID=A0A409WNZ6_PSICY|nr:hypothetical protein CVT25_003577 [Psilocybe cyanescens]
MPTGTETGRLSGTVRGVVWRGVAWRVAATGVSVSNGKQALVDGVAVARVDPRPPDSREESGWLTYSHC